MTQASVPAQIRPVFIAGCGRSGTSLLRTLLDAHRDVYIPSESLFIPDYLRDGDRLPQPLLRALLFNEPQFRCWYTGPEEIIGNAADTIVAAHERMARLDGASAWGQKTPRFVRYRNLIDQRIGPCNWLLIYRDPRAVCASMRKSGQHTNSVRNACSRWKRDNQDIVKFVNHSDDRPDNVHLVKYEMLIQEPEATLSQVFEFLGLPVVPLHDLIQHARPVFFPGSRFENNTIRDGLLPDRARISDWKTVLSPMEVSYIEHTCTTEMKTLEYAHSSTPPFSKIDINDVINKVRDIKIVFIYLFKWPSYPLYTCARKLILSAFRWRNPG